MNTKPKLTEIISDASSSLKVELKRSESEYFNKWSFDKFVTVNKASPFRIAKLFVPFPQFKLCVPYSHRTFRSVSAQCKQVPAALAHTYIRSVMEH
jgi:hypothetical protein